MSVLFTSDLHLGHENLLGTRSMFDSIEEHDETLIRNWNSVVHKGDDVWILGDIIFRSKNHASYYLDRMKGKKHLVVGNHDRDWMRKVDNISDYFESVDYLVTLKLQKKEITLCHYPMLEWPRSHYGVEGNSFLIHGHIHGLKNPDVYGYIKEHLPNALNASVDINGFRPVAFEELVENCNKWYER